MPVCEVCGRMNWSTEGWQDLGLYDYKGREITVCLDCIHKPIGLLQRTKKLPPSKKFKVVKKSLK